MESWSGKGRNFDAETEPPPEFIYLRQNRKQRANLARYLWGDDVTVVRYEISVESGVGARQVERAMIPEIHLYVSG